MKRAPQVEISVDAWDDTAFEQEPLDLDMICPKINLADPEYNIPNWSKQQCLLRIEMKAKCVRNCPLLDEIVVEMKDKESYNSQT